VSLDLVAMVCRRGRSRSLGTQLDPQRWNWGCEGQGPAGHRTRQGQGYANQ